MSIRLPLQTVLDYNDSGNVGATSIVSKQFTLPQDTDNVVLKLSVASISGTAGTVQAFLQTTDDGGTTWYDVANIQPPYVVTSSTINIVNAAALFASATTESQGRAGSIIGNVNASTLGTNQTSGLPILSTKGQVSLVYTGVIATNNGVRVQVKVNNQANRS